MIHILGIRHHGPGSAKNVKEFLEAVKPDIVLVEGPPEADPLLQWVNHAALKPPVAILVYQPDDPQRSSFYPFAEFSPEWQAIAYARKNNIHVRFMDLPIGHHIALENEKMNKQNEEPPGSAAPSVNNYALNNNEVVEAVAVRKDPISYLAEAAGYDDGEKWWEHMFEHRHNNEQVFDAVTEAMQMLRETFPQKEDRIEQLREAWMRKTIRQAEKELFQNIAVICGAWHAPALVSMPKQKEDNDLLKGLPKVKVECTWIPWTFSRLSYYSGYGAGIESPGWYDHIWNHPTDDGTRWMAKVAKLFRAKQMDTSVAHVIEAVRLAESLAGMRNLYKAGLEELNEATRTVLCNGESILMQLINDELIVSNRIGEVPTEIPKPPLQLDIEKLQKKLRLPPTADGKDYTLDLRKENDLERSIFLHRLQLLDIKWGERQDVSGKGTFKELWRLQWDPELSINIIEKGNWGNTVAEAAEKFVIDKASKADTLSTVTDLLENTIPAELHQAVEECIQRINNLAAASGDVIQLMEVVPGLVQVTRYGSVRKTDADLVLGIINSMLTRICVSLPAACTAVSEEAAQKLLELFFKLNDAVNVLQQTDITTQWQQTLQSIVGAGNTSPMIAGYATRLLADYKLLEGDALVRVFHYAMSAATQPDQAAAWLEGFLKGSGTILLIDNNLWNLVNNWIDTLDEETFTRVLPLLRRTFSSFSAPERKKLGEKVKTGGGGSAAMPVDENNLQEERARQGIPVILQLLGIKS
ncbi:hypothetical protein FAM09_19285 [Niastella caeni]|uniref:Uncharacterized protein n=1 Tax=Niastella caeni TaxID=2569763 RepID=A0A4S8HP21_9BACT|nr:DUF5682 family protein [Niastella caeni]THU37097.1 hypothetical protein FAM09_19285 [Niastella caeni]